MARTLLFNFVTQTQQWAGYSANKEVFVLIHISFSTEEINALLQILGQTPSSSGAYPLMISIQQQASKAVQAAQQPVPVEAPKL